MTPDIGRTMATQNDEAQPMSTGAQSQQQPAVQDQPAERDNTVSNGSSGEGAGSAMARLISQEQARIKPGAPEGGPHGPS